MDAARRWQVASLATAVTSLGVGGLLLSRPSVEPVAPIVLEAPAEHDVTVVPLDDGDAALDGPVPSIVGVDVVTPQTPVSLASLGSPAEAVSPAPSPTTTSTPSVTSSQRPSPTAPASDPADSPTSVDSVDSLDSD
jgi:hypothetical protein